MVDVELVDGSLELAVKALKYTGDHSGQVWGWGLHLENGKYLEFATKNAL